MSRQEIADVQCYLHNSKEEHVVENVCRRYSTCNGNDDIVSQ